MERLEQAVLSGPRDESTAAVLPVGIRCVGFRRSPRGSRLGFASFEIPELGIRFLDCGVHRRDINSDGSAVRWVNLFPARFSSSAGGVGGYAQHLIWLSERDRQTWQRALLVALDARLAKEASREEA